MPALASRTRALWDLAEQHANLDVTMRACRYPHRLRAWKELPSGLFVSVEDPGVCVGAPAKEVRLAETQTVLKGEELEQAIRTIVCREIAPGPKKDRWHPLYTTAAEQPAELLPIYRTRQNHEQGFRVGVHDLGMDAVPCGYDKESPDRKRPRFQRGPLQMIGWLVALCTTRWPTWPTRWGKTMPASTCGRCAGSSSIDRASCTKRPKR